MLRYFEGLVNPTASGAPGEPPDGLIAFYWFFIRQVKWLFLALLVIGAVQALVDAAIPVFMGQVVRVVTTTPPEQLFATGASVLGGMLVLVLVIRPLVSVVHGVVLHQAILPGVTNLIRWQSHWHVVRQNITFFHNDFAGRIGSRVLETGHTLRGSVVSIVSVVWYLAALGLIGAAVLGHANLWLVIPIAVWTAAYIGFLAFTVPKLRKGSKRIAYARSDMVGRIVDSYTNILTVKLFAKAEDEDAFVREAVDLHTGRMVAQSRWLTVFSVGLAVLSGFLIATTTGIALWLWTRHQIDIAMVATVLPMTLQITNVSARVANEITTVFEQVGTVHEGMETVAKPLGLTDRPNARPLQVTRGGITFDHVSFHYGRQGGIIEDFNLAIRPGERIGLVGRSGAGKSTLINLLLRFYDLQGGHILIDGQDIADATQESIRRNISVVTQDTSLLHRSIHDNIAYGRREATREEVIAAAERAHAREFIENLTDWRGRRGFDAHVGERGVKLSGGQRQRVAIARVILKDAPILILDEATSALDSEVEAAIQASLEELMVNRTVIAIAHRLSTIAAMDRLIVLDQGRIVEEGTHHELLQHGGHYARLWERQSGGFLAAAE